MYNSYARYGVMAHKLGARQAAYTQDGLQDVLRQISQPGPYIPKGSFPLETAYVSLFNLTTLSVHVAGGNPNTTAFREIPFA